MEEGVAHFDIGLGRDAGNLGKVHDEGTVDAHEALGREHVFGGFHGKMRDQGLPGRCQMEHHIVLHALDVLDIGQIHLAEDAFHLEENGLLFGRCHRGRCRLLKCKPVPGLLGGFQEFLIADGLEEEVQGAHLVTLEGILLEGRGKDDAGLGGQHAGEFHAVQIRHLDIQKHQFRALCPNLGQGQNGVIVATCQFKKRSAFHKALQHPNS